MDIDFSALAFSNVVLNQHLFLATNLSYNYACAYKKDLHIVAYTILVY